MKLKKLSMVASGLLIGSLLFTGCGGSDSSSNDTTPTSSTQPTTKVTKGTVTDGYVAGADVFVDNNANGKWDEGEPKTTTDENGTFEFTSDINKSAMIIAKGGVDTATDENVTDEFQLPADATSYNVTPITTLVAHLMKKGFTKEEAEVKVQKILDVKNIYANPVKDPNAAKATLKLISIQKTSDKNLSKIASDVQNVDDVNQLVTKTGANSELVSQISELNTTDLNDTENIDTYQQAVATMTKADIPNSNIHIKDVAMKLHEIHQEIRKEEVAEGLKKHDIRNREVINSVSKQLKANPNLSAVEINTIVKNAIANAKSESSKDMSDMKESNKGQNSKDMLDMKESNKGQSSKDMSDMKELNKGQSSKDMSDMKESNKGQSSKDMSDMKESNKGQSSKSASSNSNENSEKSALETPPSMPSISKK